MTDIIPGHPPRRELTEIDLQAIQWSIRFAMPDLDPNDPKGSRRRLVEEFHTWAAISPQHQQSYLEHYFWSRAVGLDPAELEMVLRGDNSGPKALHRVTPGQNPDAPFEGRKGGLTRFVASVSLTVVTVALVAWGVAAWLRPEAQTYTTGPGEPRTIPLTDGSQIELNTLSKIEVFYSARQRLVKLVGGEATFHVKPDARRPFVVSSGTAEIRVLGTEFNIEQRQGPTRIAVLQGQVEVGAAADPATLAVGQLQRVLSGRRSDERPPPLQLNSGEAVEVDGGRISDKSHPDMGCVIAWHKDTVVAVDESLPELVAEMNLHNCLKISVRGHDALTAKITGTFSTKKPEMLVKSVHSSLNLPVLQNNEGWVIGDSP